MKKFALILILGILLSLCSCNTMQNDDTAKPEDLTQAKMLMKHKRCRQTRKY